MRRAALAILGTVTGTTLLVGAKVGGHPSVGTTAVAAGPTGSAPATGGPGLTPTLPPSKKASGAPKATKVGPKTPAAPKPTSAGVSGRFTGSAVNEQYGTVQVTITMTAGRLTDVSATYPTSPSRSADINSGAIPQLRSEALAAQSAHIATVSGATYTSGAYQSSLQSALDRAHA